MPIVELYTWYVPWRGDLQILLLGYTDTLRNRDRYGDQMDAILTDVHLDTRMERCILMNVVIPS